MHSAQISWNQTFLQLLSYVSDIEGDGLLAAVIVKYLSLQSIFLFQGRWLYALLACLEKPLLPEAHSSIRQLARRCAQLRSTLVGHNPTISCKALSLCAITPCLKRPQQAMFFSFFVEIWWYLILFTLIVFSLLAWLHRTARKMINCPPSTCSSVLLPGKVLCIFLIWNSV